MFGITPAAQDAAMELAANGTLSNLNPQTGRLLDKLFLLLLKGGCERRRPENGETRNRSAPHGELATCAGATRGSLATQKLLSRAAHNK
jgi:hypothetical protein